MDFTLRIEFSLATDARAAIEYVWQVGIAITHEPTDVPLGAITATVAFFKGPSGEVIAFFQTHSSVILGFGQANGFD